MSLLESTVAGQVCVLRLNYPPVYALTLGMLEEISSAIRGANADPGIHGIVITGSPEPFSAGADVGLFRSLQTAEDAIRLSRTFQKAFQEIED